MNSDERSLLHKRWTLNFLIQGAAAHIYLTANHLVRDQLDAIKPGLTDQYQRLVVLGQWNYCCGDLMLMQGRPNRWYGRSKSPQKPIADHPVLADHANDLAKAEACRVRDIAREKRMVMVPVFSPIALMVKAKRLRTLEQPHRALLASIAVDVVRQIFNVPPGVLSATLTDNVAFGDLDETTSFVGQTYRQNAAGYGGVLRINGEWKVVARAWVFPLLVHELVKGLVELICLHGMCDWDENSYRIVTKEADRVENETWCIQAGPELWRRLLAAAPRDISLAEVIMQLARLPPDPLHDLILAIVTEKQEARDRLRALVE